MSTCLKAVPPDVNTVFQFTMLLLITEVIFLAAPTISRHFRIHECGTISYAFLWSIQAIDKFFNLLRQFFKIAFSTSS